MPVHEPVGALLARAASGRPPPEDGRTQVLPQPRGPVAAVLAFAHHHVVAADIDPAWVRRQLPDGDLSAPVAPRFLGALAARLGRTPGSFDVVLASTGLGRPALDLRSTSADDHPRAVRARRYRTDVQAFETVDGAGLLVVGRGLAGRWEAAFEVAAHARGRGLGRALAASARNLVPAGEALFVQVAPGNVASLRAVLGAGGFVPIGGEVLFPGPT